MLEAVIFDHDGTLAPTSKRQEAWFKTWSVKNDKVWNFDSTEKFMAFYNWECAKLGGVQNVYDVLGLPCDMNDKKHVVWPAYEEFNKQNPVALYPGVAEMLKEVFELGSLGKDVKRNKRLRLMINTTNSWASIYGDLAKAGVLHYFDSRITDETLREYQGCGDAEGMKKPSPVSLALCLGLGGADGEFALHVGDTRNDLRASHKVIRLNPSRPESLVTVGACWGYEGREVLEKGAEMGGSVVHFDYLADHPSEIVGIVKNHQ